MDIYKTIFLYFIFNKISLEKGEINAQNKTNFFK